VTTGRERSATEKPPHKQLFIFTPLASRLAGIASHTFAQMTQRTLFIAGFGPEIRAKELLREFERYEGNMGGLRNEVLVILRVATFPFPKCIKRRITDSLNLSIRQMLALLINACITNVFEAIERVEN
jgi:hypothetical protein